MDQAEGAAEHGDGQEERNVGLGRGVAVGDQRERPADEQSAEDASGQVSTLEFAHGAPFVEGLVALAPPMEEPGHAGRCEARHGIESQPVRGLAQEVEGQDPSVHDEDEIE